MEIQTAVNLWKGMDFDSIPLDATILENYTRDSIQCTEFYFSAIKYDQTNIRVYARLSRPLGVDCPPIVMLVDDIEVALQRRSIDKYIEQGFAVFQYDYLGQNSSYEKYTQYPSQLGFCNFYQDRDNMSTAFGVPQDSCWYYWSIVTFRAVKMLDWLISLPDYNLSDKVAIVGIGCGGTHAIKAASLFSTIKTMVVKYDADTLMQGADKERIISNAAFSSGSYIPFIDKPFLLELCSNEADGSFDNLVELYSAIGAKNDHLKVVIKRLSISENSNHQTGNKQSNNELNWLRDTLQSVESLVSIPLMPTITKKTSQNSVYLNVFVDESVDISSVQIFVSDDDTDNQILSQFRYWYQVKTEYIAQGEYLAKLQVESGIRAYRFFATVAYQNGYCFSTPLNKISTTTPIGNIAIKNNRLVYDGDMSIDNWIVVDRKALSKGGVVSRQGPHDISGVSGLGGELVTFKVGSQKFRGEQNEILQLIMSSQTSQDLIFTAISKHNLEEFVCNTIIQPQNTWSKILLSERDFRSASNSRFDWADVVCIKINSKEPIIVSNMLWV